MIKKKKTIERDRQRETVKLPYVDGNDQIFLLYYMTLDCSECFISVWSLMFDAWTLKVSPPIKQYNGRF